MTMLALAAASARRLSRDRTALLFLVLLPVLVILIIGTVVTDTVAFRVGVVEEAPGVESGRLLAQMEASSALELHRFDDEATAAAALRRVELDTVVVLSAGMDAASASGRPVEVVVLGDQANATNRAAGQAVAAAVGERSGRLLATRFHQAQAGGALEESASAVDRLAATVPPVGVRTDVVDSESGYLPTGFEYSAPTMLVLFVFITSLAGAAALIDSRRLGVHDRMRAGPVAARSIVAGEGVSFLGIALLQSALIVGVGAVVFGVDWGDPLAAGALVLVWAFIGTGAGMLAGTLFRTSEQAAAIGSTVGIMAGMLGGCMWPLEIVGPAMRAVGHAVPHAWAIDAWVEVLSKGGGVGSIVTELVVLSAFAAGLLALASLRLQRTLAS